MDDCQLCSLCGKRRRGFLLATPEKTWWWKEKVKHYVFFFYVWGWGGCAQWCSPCDVLFLDEELQLLGVEIKEWKVSDGGRDWDRRRKAKKKKPEGGGGGWYRVRRPLCLSFFDVFSLLPFLLFFLFYPLVFLVFLSGFSFRSLPFFFFFAHPFSGFL